MDNKNANMINNDGLHLSLRKNCDILAVVGLGVIIFGIWSVIKTVLFTALDQDGIRSAPLEGGWERIAFWIIIGLVLAIDLGLRFYVGRSAISESRGRKKSGLYIALALMMAIISFGVLVGGFIVSKRMEDVGASVVSIIVEMTSSILLVEMAVSAIKVRRINKELKEQES